MSLFYEHDIVDGCWGKVESLQASEEQCSARRASAQRPVGTAYLKKAPGAFLMGCPRVDEVNRGVSCTKPQQPQVGVRGARAPDKSIFSLVKRSGSVGFGAQPR